MEKALLDGNLGSVGHYELSLQNGHLRAEASAKAPAGVSGGAFVEINTDDLLDFIASKIPGHFDDIAIGLAKEALKKV